MRQFVRLSVLAAAAGLAAAGCKDDRSAGGTPATNPVTAPARRATPQSAAQAFMDAVGRNDFAAARSLVTLKLRDRHAADFDRWAARWRDELAGATLTGDAEPVEGSGHAQRVAVMLVRNGKPKLGHVKVRRDGEAWYWDDN
ncbi:MAG TPA: hypothetical protein VF796_09420 [Humisphaera sp.]